MGSINRQYREAKETIAYTVSLFCRKYGGEYQELLSEASEYFLKAVEGYDEDRSALKTWVRIKVWNGLLESYSRKMYRLNILKPVNDFDLGTVEQYTTEFDLCGFLDELSPEAATVVNLVIKPPVDLREAIDRKNETPRGCRSSLRIFLRNMGWSREQIRNAFLEIGDALQCGS